MKGLILHRNVEGVWVNLVENKKLCCILLLLGAMSFGSISYETHSTLAVAMNK